MKLTHANLLTTGNPKTLKGETDGYFTAVLHLAPSTLSGKNVCPFATAACIFGCLNHAGRGGIFKKGEITNAIQLARIARTNWYHDNRADFLLNLERAITLHVKRAKQNGLTPCIRLNGTSDLSIENWGILERFPDVQFYDYTAVPKRTFDFANHKLPENYHLTFSRKETPLNHTAAKLALKRGVSVAVVFDTKKGAPLPSQFWGKPVIDGDLSDLRFRDDRGVIVGLRAKGKKAKADTTGFVVLV